MKLKTEPWFETSVHADNRRSRSGRGKSPKRRTAVTKYVLDKYVDSRREMSVLDFGAGSKKCQTVILQAQGFHNVRSLDLPANMGKWVRSPDQWSYDYDLVMASNVLNVQPSVRELQRTIRLIAALTHGEAVVNYPSSPRFMPELSVSRMHQYLDGGFRWVQRVPREEVGGNVIWVCKHTLWAGD